MKQAYWLVSAVLLVQGMGEVAAGPKAKPRAAGVRGEGTAAVTVTAPADAPTRPTEMYKKTQPNELRGSAAAKSIRKLEDLFYIMHKPDARIWVWRARLDAQEPRANGDDEIHFVEDQLAKVDALMLEVAATDAAWPRLAEYQTTRAFLQRVHQAQRAYYGAVAQAVASADAAVAAEAAAAWQAKRTRDDGVAAGLHAQSVGTLVFANTDPTTAGRGVTSLSVDGPVVARAYFAESPWNALHTAGVDCSAAPPSLRGYRIRTFFRLASGDRFQLEDAEVDETTFQRATSHGLAGGGDLTSGGKFTNRDEPGPRFRWIARVGGEAPVGTTPIAFDVRVWCYGALPDGVEVATAAVSLTATAKGKQALEARASFGLAASRHAGAALAAFRKVIDKAYRPTHEVLTFRTAGEWALVRNPVGVVLRRSLPAVVLTRKRGDHGCKMISLELSQEFDGRSYGPSQITYESSRHFVCGWH